MKRLSFRKLVPIYIVVLGAFIAITWWGNQAISTISANASAPIGPIVIIDAGHGGVDGGATSISGVLESKINLEIAQKLNDLLHMMGIHTKMIRTEDISIHTEGESIAAKKSVGP